MSIINLATIKSDLRVAHSSDDSILQVYLNAAEDEALRFLNSESLPLDTNDELAPSIYGAVFLLVRSKYDAENGDEIAKLRRCAETMLMPYRIELGV